jgi:hypothetical protein
VTAAARAVLAMSEDAWKSRVMDTAKTYGWMVCHYRPAWTERGYRTAVEGDKGCLDLILARGGVVLLAELKSMTGKPTPAQRAWLAAAGAQGRLWRPSDWPDVFAELSAPRAA